MHSRMLHLGVDGHQVPQAYSIYGDFTNSVDRTQFNEMMLDACEKCPNVTIYFEHHLSQVNFDVGSMEFIQGPNKIKQIRYADLIVGADGAYSKMRGQMMREMRMNYQQEYINTGYCELHMPSKVIDGNRTYALDPNHLHVWPRHSFLITAIPDLTHTFTCTLFLPFEVFDRIDDKEKLIQFFATHFKDLLPLIGPEQLVNDYFNNPRGSLISIKTAPHHISDKGVIVGDAAHAMVPFFGQGLNCGLEDIEILHKILDEHHVRPLISHQGVVPGLAQALTAYSDERVKDAHAICDLAMYNHYELRSAVTSVRFLAQKKLEHWIHYYFPHLIIPLYSMVSFSSMPYSQTVKRWHTQKFWLNVFIGAVTLTVIPASAWLISTTFLYNRAFICRT
ncbi:hypothetical protein BCR42DRAFT_475213 [Absidia repens]|uniref:FAD-binding domain-containing protein n=1 Tax=Absidia repens TaxID=90262 RepID=A0A1X2IT32_9FUNG|nr:hypothetical protein BCR42DRAFT_475213 [Absidia repens]